MRWGIRRQLIVLTLIPNILIAVLLGGYLIHVRLYDYEKHLQTEGHYIVNHLTKSFAVDNLASPLATNTITNAALSYYDVNAAALYDTDGNIVSQNGTLPQFSTIINVFKQKKLENYPGMIHIKDHIFFVHPIMGQTNVPSAYMVVGLNNDKSSIIASREIVATIIIALIALFISLYFSLKISSEITVPLTEVTHAIEKLKSGQLNVRIKLPAKGELKQLKLSMNSLIDAFGLINAKRKRVG